MRFNNRSPSNYQDKIRGGTLERIDIELGLQNKCINDTYLYYDDIKNDLLPIGEDLYKIMKKIDNTIERIFNFSFYLSSEEILLLEDIRTKLYTYGLPDTNKKAIQVVGNIGLRPVNPSISYMTYNFMNFIN